MNPEYWNEIDYERAVNNSDDVRRALEGDDFAFLEEVKNHYGFSVEQMNLFGAIAKLRKSVVDQRLTDWNERMKNNPQPTQEELSMGIYWEQIEPQVKKAMSVLRSKGYGTYESGFGDWDGQQITFESEYLNDWQPPQHLIDELNLYGIHSEILPNQIKLHQQRFLGIEDLTNVWDKITEALPDLGRPAPDCQLSSAQYFREQHSATNKR